MRFFADFGVPEKLGVARLSAISASALVARFQDRLVMTALITLRTWELYHISLLLSSLKRKKAEKTRRSFPAFHSQVIPDDLPLADQVF